MGWNIEEELFAKRWEKPARAEMASEWFCYLPCIHAAGDKAGHPLLVIGATQPQFKEIAERCKNN